MTTYLPTRPGRGVGPPTTYLPRGGDIQVGGRPIVGSAMVPEQLPDLGSSQILARLEPKPCALRTPSLGLRRLAWWLSQAPAMQNATQFAGGRARRAGRPAPTTTYLPQRPRQPRRRTLPTYLRHLTVPDYVV